MVTASVLHLLCIIPYIFDILHWFPGPVLMFSIATQVKARSNPQNENGNHRCISFSLHCKRSTLEIYSILLVAESQIVTVINIYKIFTVKFVYSNDTLLYQIWKKYGLYKYGKNGAAILQLYCCFNSSITKF